MAIPVLIDCDPGRDDAVALMLALGSPELEVLGITTVAGNVPLDKTTPNALRVLEFLGREDIPVAAGADRPFVRPLYTAPHVHGTSGLAGFDLPEPRTAPVEAHAVDFLAGRLLEAPGPVTLIALGPLMNVALLLALRPDAAERIERMVVMQGAIGLGNSTTSAEFNTYVDPEAAQRVFSSGIDLTMVGLDVTDEAFLGHERVEGFRACGRVGETVATFLGRDLERRRDEPGYRGVVLPDAVTVAEVVRPGVVTTLYRNVVVECGSEYTRGRTVVDLKERTGREPNTHVAVGVDTEAFVSLLAERLAAHP